jgi:bifunctional non-homologous end joining protein LigD
MSWRNPLDALPATAKRRLLKRAQPTWVSPMRATVAQIGFTEWTPEGKLRHPRFLGLRDDKRPEDVVREA